jgi:hypothetical protein
MICAIRSIRRAIPEQETDMDKRRFTRVPSESRVIIRYNQTVISGESKDLSLKGLYVKVPQALPLKEQVEVDIRVADEEEQRRVTGKATVARISKNGVALEFSAMDMESFSVLEKIITDRIGRERRIMMETLQSACELAV